MALSNEEFETLVRRLEVDAAAHPASYKMRVGLLAMLGFVYVLLFLAVILGLLGGLVATIYYGHRLNSLVVKLGIVLIASAGVLLRALWVRFPTPEGRRLPPEVAGPLRETLREFSAKLKAPRIHEIIVTNQYNAAIAQVPRLGFFGWNRNYLFIGVPLMLGLSPAQFCSVLAHEYGHLSKSHARFSNWIYRVRATYGRLLESIEAGQGGMSWAITPFLKWYAPFLNAYSFVLARANEYEADRCAAQLTSSRDAADALLTIPIRSSALASKFWEPILRVANEQPAPPARVMQDLPGVMKSFLDPGDMQKALDEALLAKTDYADTHPSLTDRLASLGEAARIPPPVAYTAADCFLGASLERLLVDLDVEWRGKVGGSWRAQHERAAAARQRLAHLNVELAANRLTEDEALERCQVIDGLESRDSAIEAAHAALASWPTSASLSLFLGIALAGSKDPDCVRWLEQAANSSEDYGLPALAWLAHYYGAAGDIENREACEQRLALLSGKRERQLLSLRTLKGGDLMQSHELTAEQLDTIREWIRHYAVKTAWLVRRAPRKAPGDWSCLLMVKSKPKTLELDGSARRAALIKEMANDFPLSVTMLIIDRHSVPWRMRRRVPKVANSQIHRG